MAEPPAGRPHSDQILLRLAGLHPKLIDLSLGRIARLTARLGHPERHSAPIIHVAGTNGKGSTIAFMRAMLEAAGQRVQAYISPHLVRFHERIRLTGGLIDEVRLCALLEECESANAGAPITYFEITTAAAFLAFSRQPADFLLLEVGLGGRFDATNLVSRPAVTVLTPISLDHEHFLGSTVADIAGEKAGILKPGVAGVVGPQPAAAMAVIRDRAAAIGAPLLAHGEDWTVAAQGPDQCRYRDQYGVLTLPAPSLRGDHQIVNAGLAIAALRRIEPLPLKPGDIATGLTRAKWPGRLQRLDTGPLAALLPGGGELWLDGGHNPAAAEVLHSFFADRRPLHLIVGMMGSKKVAGFLAPLAPLATGLQAVAIPGEPGGLAPIQLAAAAVEVGIPARVAECVHDAVAAVSNNSSQGEPPTVLICGSLYLAGSVLANQ